MRDRTKLLLFVIIFIVLYFAPLDRVNLQRAILEAFLMLQDYAREHVLFCLIPAFFIAGAISIFVSKEAVIKYSGTRAKRILAHSIASVSKTTWAVTLAMAAGWIYGFLF